MKKLLIISTIILSTSIYAKSHGPAGCGLGEFLFKGKEGLPFNILAATVNGTGGQTFAMSTGTLGCEDAHTGKVTAVSFIEANQIALSNDIARGNGETLNAYLSLINKDASNATKLQDSFETIFAANNTPSQINKSILSVLN